MEDWKGPEAAGSIYPTDMRSLFLKDTSSVISRHFIEFKNHITFNGIKLQYPDIPYLLQHRRKSPTCNVSTIAPRGGTCPHLLQLPFQSEKWTEIVLLDGSDSREIAHPIHQHGGWFWLVGGGVFPHRITRHFLMEEHRGQRLRKVQTNL